MGKASLVQQCEAWPVWSTELFFIVGEERTGLAYVEKQGRVVLLHWPLYLMLLGLLSCIHGKYKIAKARVHQSFGEFGCWAKYPFLAFC